MNKIIDGLTAELLWIDNNPGYYDNREHQELVKTNIAIRYKCVKMMSDLDKVLEEGNNGQED